MLIEDIPLACDLEAIPAVERAGHLAAAEQLLLHLAQEKLELPDGYAFRFGSEQYPQVTNFVGNERRCCPFLAFTLEVPPSGGPLWLRITAPADAKDMLVATLLERQPAATVAAPAATVAASLACDCCGPASA